MREIKFRAWDKQRNLMIFNGPFLIMPSGTHHVKDSKDGVILWPNVQLMQFTGLRDKNGKEIYEGDLLKDATYHPPEFPPLVVEYEPYSGGWKPFAVTTFAPRGVIVIGNIHENGDLLK